jgi:hypothetical protein
MPSKVGTPITVGPAALIRVRVPPVFLAEVVVAGAAETGGAVLDGAAVGGAKVVVAGALVVVVGGAEVVVAGVVVAVPQPDSTRTTSKSNPITKETALFIVIHLFYFTYTF